MLCHNIAACHLLIVQFISCNFLEIGTVVYDGHCQSQVPKQKMQYSSPKTFIHKAKLPKNMDLLE